MKYTITILILLFSSTSFGQISEKIFQSDLKFIYENLKKSASYKTQKESHAAVNRKYDDLKSFLENNDVTEIDFFIKAYELLDVVKDNHNSITGNTESFTYNDLQKKDFLFNLKKKPEYNYFPKTQIDLDSLENVLNKKSIDDYEGIYYYENYFKIAIFKNKNDLYEGIILYTKIPSWERGETILYLKPKGKNHFRMFIGGLINKRLSSSTTDFDEGIFRAYNWTKSVDNLKFYSAAYPNEKYVYKKLNDSFGYLKLGTFNSNNQGIKLSTDFYNKISDSLTTSQLIVDLRNNGGGGDKSSKQFLNLLKKYKGKIYIITNYYTGSNAEQFIVNLTRLREGVVIFGDKTAGVLTYGHNYDTSLETPSEMFKIQFTDLKDGWRKYIKYEDLGIEPTVYLDEKTDWIEQIIKICNH